MEFLWSPWRKRLSLNTLKQMRMGKKIQLETAVCKWPASAPGLKLELESSWPAGIQFDFKFKYQRSGRQDEDMGGKMRIWEEAGAVERMKEEGRGG